MPAPTAAIRPRFLAFATAALLAAGAVFGTGPAAAQDMPIAFGGVRGDTKAPVEIAADSLSVDQSTGKARFSGNVQIGQGDMRLSASNVAVIYADGDRRRIRTLQAEGNVTLVSGPDAAEADSATYDVESGMITLSGDVLVTQGQNVLSGQTMQVNLASGAAQVQGRVRSVLQPAGQ